MLVRRLAMKTILPCTRVLVIIIIITLIIIIKVTSIVSKSLKTRMKGASR